MHRIDLTTHRRYQCRPPVTQAPPQSFLAPSLKNQFKEFRTQLDESGSLREKIRAVVVEIEPISKYIHISLLLVHQSRPVSGTILISIPD